MPTEPLRYVDCSGARWTRVVSAFDADRSAASAPRAVPGSLGIPFVAFDGTLGGLAHDGRSLVLAVARAGRPGESRFAVVSTPDAPPAPADRAARDLVVRRAVAGRAQALPRRARSCRQSDVPRARLRRRARRARPRGRDRPALGGRAMTGPPVTRATGPGGVWAYTLYQKPGGLPFVHALDTVRGKALCIELPWRGEPGEALRRADAGAGTLARPPQRARARARDDRHAGVRSPRAPQPAACGLAASLRRSPSCRARPSPAAPRSCLRCRARPRRCRGSR